MKIQTWFSAAEAEGADFHGRVAVVIDVIRATTVIVEALASGARAIYPTASTEEAIRLANSLGREDTLLCGERKGVKVEGFDLGNSPREFVSEKVAGKRLVMNTTNGTRAFLSAAAADRVVSLSFLNLTAVVREIIESPRLSIVCAGKEGRFSLDDAVCAGILIREIASGNHGEIPELELNDQARAAFSFADAFQPDPAFLRKTAAGDALVPIGLEEDLEFCAQRDRHSIVPEMKDRMIKVLAGEVAPPRSG